MIIVKFVNGDWEPFFDGDRVTTATVLVEPIAGPLKAIGVRRGKARELFVAGAWFMPNSNSFKRWIVPGDDVRQVAAVKHVGKPR